MGGCCAKGPLEGGSFQEPGSRAVNEVTLTRRISDLGDDFMSCREDFSVASDVGSLSSVPCSPFGSPRRMSMAGIGATATTELQEQAYDPATVPTPTDESIEGGSLYDEPRIRDVGCLGLLEAISEKLHLSEEVVHQSSRRRTRSRKRQEGKALGHTRPDAGVSLNIRDMSQSINEISSAYEDVHGSGFKIRGLDYMKSKMKVNSEKSIYRLTRADMFSSDRKQNHVADLVNLPDAPPLKHRISDNLFYPPLLIINIQLPTYAPSFFGGSSDGPGWSLVFYFTLNDEFDPETFPNKKALGLFTRFVQNGKESDGTSTRDRFKIIPRVVNVAEWAQKGPLSSSEHKLLSSYNEKPVLARPQHLYTHGPNYLEVDLDIHTYTYIARSALLSFMTRLSSVIYEVAFVIQGNAADELPEQVLACARIYRTDFTDNTRAYTSFIPKEVISDGGDKDT